MKRNNNRNRRQPNQNRQRRTITRRRGGNQSRARRSLLAPVSKGSTFKTTNPRSEMGRNGGMLVAHREPLGPVFGSVAFVNVQYPINPGMMVTFPWLSRTAQSFEAYKFRKLRFVFFTSSSSAFTGQVVIAPDYNSSDSAPPNLQTLEQYKDAYRGLPWSDGDCVLDCNGMGTGMMGPKRYIRYGALPDGQDIKTYDVANINIGVSGQANGAQIGELWVEYVVELVTPESQTPGDLAPSGMLANTSGTTGVITNLLGVVTSQSGLIGISNVLNVVTFTNLQPGATYTITFGTVAGTVTSVPTITAGAGFTLINPQFSNLMGTVAGIAMSYFLATASTAVVTLGGITVLTNPTESWISIAQFAHSIQME